MACVLEAFRLFDHYHIRVVVAEATDEKKPLRLAKPPRDPGEKSWWQEDDTNARRFVIANYTPCAVGALT